MASALKPRFDHRFSRCPYRLANPSHELIYVGSWHEADDPGCPLSRPLSGDKRTLNAQGEPFRF
jgi:hypothetical protein